MSTNETTPRNKRRAAAVAALRKAGYSNTADNLDAAPHFQLGLRAAILLVTAEGTADRHTTACVDRLRGILTEDEWDV